jgi:hypothetical protein
MANLITATVGLGVLVALFTPPRSDLATAIGAVLAAIAVSLVLI